MLLESAIAWLRQDAIGQKVYWTVRWLFYPLTVLIDIRNNPEDGALEFKVLTILFGLLTLTTVVALPFQGSGLAITHPWIPFASSGGLFLLYLGWGCIHHVNMEEIYGHGL